MASPLPRDPGRSITDSSHPARSRADNMTVTPHPFAAVRRRASAVRFGTTSAHATFYLLASISTGLLAGSSAPTPLYAVYQAAWGFSSITVTVIFGIYALA